jgi:Ferric reductase NAD binding domain
LTGNWASAVHDLLRRKLEAVPHAELSVPAPPDPLLRPPGPLRRQYQLYKDSMRQAAQVHAACCCQNAGQATRLDLLMGEHSNDVAAAPPTKTRSASAPSTDMTARPIAQQAQFLSRLELLVDGPFGAPAVAYRRFPVVLLVGAGVGVTPFLSILADAVEQHAARTADAGGGPPCSTEDAKTAKYCTPQREQPVQKVHFHWLVREPTVPRWAYDAVCCTPSLERMRGQMCSRMHANSVLPVAACCANNPPAAHV